MFPKINPKENNKTIKRSPDEIFAPKSATAGTTTGKDDPTTAAGASGKNENPLPKTEIRSLELKFSLSPSIWLLKFWFSKFNAVFFWRIFAFSLSKS